MLHGTFIWADLSTFRRDVTEPFYSAVMGWRFDDGLASTGGLAVAQVYTMPEKFQKIGMPSFWMSYIAVSDINAAIDAACDLGGKVELGPEPFEGGQIALIRDPLGAGFTVYEGAPLGEVARGSGSRLGHALFVSDASAVRDFYAQLFGWTFGAGFGGMQSILAHNQRVASLHEVPSEEQRGKEQYWAVLFAHDNLAMAQARALEHGGQIVSETQLPEGPTTIIADPDGGTFFLVGKVAT